MTTSATAATMKASMKSLASVAGNGGASAARALDSILLRCIRTTILMSEIDAETFYKHQRSIGTVWGVALPPWEDLSWEERLEWEQRLIEQEARDSHSGS